MNKEWGVGDYIEWSTLRGDQYKGLIIEMDSNVGIVACVDGIIRTCDNL